MKMSQSYYWSPVQLISKSLLLFSNIYVVKPENKTLPKKKKILACYMLESLL